MLAAESSLRICEKADSCSGRTGKQEIILIQTEVEMEAGITDHMMELSELLR